MNKNLQRQAYEAFVRSGASPVFPSEVDMPLTDGTYRTSAANAGWVFWQAAQAALIDVHADQPAKTQRYNELTGHPTYLLDPGAASQAARFQEVYGDMDAEAVVANSMIHKPS